MLGILALCLTSCQTKYDHNRAFVKESAEQLRQSLDKRRDNPTVLTHTESLDPQILARIDSALALSLETRFPWRSLAYEDSLNLALLHWIRIDHLYYRNDTTRAVSEYLKALPWLSVLHDSLQIVEMQRYAETVGDALDETLSPNVAGLAYEAFARAEHLAITSGDVTLFHVVDSSRAAVAHRILTMSDSVRAAFGPTVPQPPLSIPTGLIAFIAFITLSGAAGGGLWWHIRNKRQPPAPSTLPIQLSNAELALEAIWQICYSPQHIPDEAVTTVNKECRDMDSQRAIFMLAGLLILGHDHNPSKAAATIRQRLLRHFTKNDCGLQPDVLLPRTREEFKTWFAKHYNKQRPSVYVARHP